MGEIGARVRGARAVWHPQKVGRLLRVGNWELETATEAAMEGYGEEAVMRRWEPTFTSGFASFARRLFAKLLWTSVVAGLASALLWSSSAASAGRAGTVIACFHEKSRRYSAEVHPPRCHLRGFRDQHVVGISVKNMKWGHWGARHTRAAFGNDVRTGQAVRVIVFRPIACEGGVRWYSQVVIFFPGNSRGFEFASPVCDPKVGSR